ncbi:uncharacterized protein [Spinacia oleracea]|uniref:Endonuclease/exonuclease/phosphatase domain-containing protein n=1 Tax=Spinacia oleracea TaxID=3562 RepID=A0ABM3RGP1_SPIOL|nr:uncharacterized protein LOC130469462 [Spinacia oleracea]
MQGCATLPMSGCSGKYARFSRSSPGSGAPPKGGVNYPRFHGKGRGKGKGSRMRFGTWNIGSLTGRLVEVVEVIRRRRINILGLQETKWVGNKSREIAPWGYKLWYSGKTRGRNGVGILIDREYIDDVVDVSRKSGRIMSIKLVIGDEVVTIVSAYAPQAVGVKVRFTQEIAAAAYEKKKQTSNDD